jgi:predicted TIM-barrel fold metal-dependent hydrolase
VIIDAHTHIFPPRMIEQRGRIVGTDAGFAEMYGDASARMVTADALLDSMERAGVDVAIAAGFWWQSGALAEEHTAYLVDVAAASGGRILPFVPVGGQGAEARIALDRAIRHGARGLGEVRPGQARSAGDVGHLLQEAAAGSGLPALVHASEDVGHAYAGKRGGYEPGPLYRLLERYEELRVIAAHLGGGLAFYAHMPEVRALVDGGRLVFDTAAAAYLYRPDALCAVLRAAGPASLLWGSDFPLRAQDTDRAWVEAALSDDDERAAVLGSNAARFLGLSD